jgi:hypothetical protein
MMALCSFQSNRRVILRKTCLSDGGASIKLAIGVAGRELLADGRLTGTAVKALLSHQGSIFWGWALWSRRGVGHHPSTYGGVSGMCQTRFLVGSLAFLHK